jgi:hypothetical protein
MRIAIHGAGSYPMAGMTTTMTAIRTLLAEAMDAARSATQSMMAA